MNDTDAIVISGMSGRFPECNNIQEFQDALYNGDYLVTQDNRRYPTEIKGMAHWMGKLPEIDKFDASYFGVYHKQAHVTDPRHRILLETVYEAIVDAGYNPDELRGSNTGVFVGMHSFTNIKEMRQEEMSGYSYLGTSLYSSANRISYSFDFRGPSMAIDTACASGIYAVITAFEKIQSGEIDSAIACSAQLLLDPEESINFTKLQVLSPDGFTRSFNENRNGFARSEAVCCVFLQRKPNCRRLYATVLAAKGNTDGFSTQGFTFPNVDAQYDLMKDVYLQSKLNPNDVSYIEIHGTGTVSGDAVECEAVTKIFGRKERTEPLLIGSVKSQMGHGEHSSGIVSVIKILSAMESGILPGNINAEPVDVNLSGIKEGKLKVVTKNTKWTSGLAAINSFGIGGSNGHALIERHEKVKKPLSNETNRLVQVSGRTQEGVNYMLDEIEKSKADEEFLGLLDEIHKTNIQKHTFRGYTVFGEPSVRNVTKCNYKTRPIVFIYSGLGTQWAGMGRDLMTFEVFRNTFLRCAEAVNPYGVDLLTLLSDISEDELKDMVNTFTIIAAIEISLTELLYSLDIRPDFFAGHSSGEVACAYANGDLTPEQAILLAYARGYALKQETLPAGEMISVGLSKEEVEKILPNDVYIACENGKQNVTLSGLSSATNSIVETLKSRDIFYRVVNTGGYAFHSKHVSKCSSHLLNFCKNVVTNPQPRSPKWISTSVQPEQRHEKWTRLNCAQYQANNFQSKVLFNQICSEIPENAIVIEIAPDGIFQGILKRELTTNNTIVTLTSRKATSHKQFFLSAIGEIYNAGAQPNLRKLYKDTVFPVSRGTKMISPLVKWDHSISWYVPYYKNKDYFGEVVKINISDEEHSYLKGHTIDDRVLMPAFGYMEMVWTICANQIMKDLNECPVIFENVKFLRATILHEDDPVEFVVNVMKNTGHFEIFEGNSIVVSGVIRLITNGNIKFGFDEELFKNTNKPLNCQKDDFYKYFKLKRTIHSGFFKSVVDCDILGHGGRVEWMDSLVGFLDGMSQIALCESHTKNLVLLTEIKKVIIDPESHFKEVEIDKYVTVRRNPSLGVLKTKGIEIVGLEYEKAPKRERTQPDPILENYQFIPYEPLNDDTYDLLTSFRVAFQIILQNTIGLIKQLTICHITDDVENNNEEFSKNIKKILSGQILSEVIYTQSLFNNINTTFDSIIINKDILKNVEIDNLTKKLRDSEGFIIYMGDFSATDTTPDLDIIFKSSSLSLLRNKQDVSPNNKIIEINNNNLQWVDELTTISANSKHQTIFLLSQNEETSGIIGLMAGLLTKNSHVKYKSILINDNNDSFDINKKFYKDQMSKNLNINVLKGNIWGTFVHLPFEEVKSKHVNNATIGLQQFGDISSFNWIEIPEIGVNDVPEFVNVHYSALNYEDYLAATKKTVNDSVSNFGYEYSGINKSGKKVMGIVSRCGISFKIKSDPCLTWEVPPWWNLEEAATVPVIYCMCYYALVHRGHIEKDDSVLINAPIELSKAAAAVALNFCNNVFVTVNIHDEISLIKKLLPEVEVGLVQDSSFLDIIKRKTNGDGLDIIFNANNDGSFEHFLHLLPRGGRILDLCENIRDYQNSLNKYSYYSISLENFIEEKSSIKKKIRDLVQEGISSKLVKPLPSMLFPRSDIVEAFGYLTSERYKKKILLHLQNEHFVPIQATPKIYFDPHKSYLIVGGLGGVGLELTEWLITKGAMKIVLNGRRNIWNGYQLICMRNWSKLKNVVVKVDTSDASTLDGARDLIECCQKLGPVGGVFNLAGVVKDADIIDQTIESFESVLKPKMRISENLDQLTRTHCPLLNYFVLYSSFASCRGQLGQTNYGMANSILERICEQRKKDNLPALSVQWGPIADVGMLGGLNPKKVAFIYEVAGACRREELAHMKIDDIQDLRSALLIRIPHNKTNKPKSFTEFLHMFPQSIDSCFDTLEKFIIQNTAVAASAVLSDNKTAFESASIKSPVSVVAHILGIQDIDSIDKHVSLSQLGMDSLIMTEIKQTLYRHFQLDCELENIKTFTIETLSNM